MTTHCPKCGSAYSTGSIVTHQCPYPTGVTLVTGNALYHDVDAELHARVSELERQLKSLIEHIRRKEAKY